MKLLIEAKADVNAKDKDGFTVCHCAAQFGHAPILQYVAAKKANLLSKDNDNRTPLHWAAYKGQP